MTEMHGLEKIIGRIIDDAEQYRAEAIKSAESDIAEINDRYKSQADFIISSGRDRALKEAEAILLRARSSSETMARNTVLEAKAKLTDQVYAEVYRRLLELPEKDYAAFVTKLLCDIISADIRRESENSEYYESGELTSADEYIVSMNEKDAKAIGKKLISAAEKVLSGTNKNVRLGESSDIDGGFLLYCGNVETNCSLSLIVRKLREDTEQQVFSTLFAAQ